MIIYNSNNNNNDSYRHISMYSKGSLAIFFLVVCGVVIYYEPYVEGRLL